MDSIVERIERQHFWSFHGGIHPPEMKFLTNDKPILSLDLPDQLIIPIQQHIGSAGELLINVGDYVLKGQALTKSSHPMAVTIHAPTSGKVTAIKPHQSAHPSAMPELCVFIEPDGKELWRERTIRENFTSLTSHELLTLIANAGIAGMGGAGFPTAVKAGTPEKIRFLIINAAECEPYITADDLLIREQSAQILKGIDILRHIINPEQVLIGIEDNKPEAIEILQQLTENHNHIHVCVLPTKYPTGGEKQLIQALTGIEIGSGKLPAHHGMVVQNIATCYAIADAVINDIPLIQRVVTVTGQALARPQNVWALIGTPINFLLEQCELVEDKKNTLIMGGPMMGFNLPHGNIPVVKTTNCIIAPTAKEIPAPESEQECIRCGQCAEVCPSQLLPQEMQWSAKANDQKRLLALNLFDCIECGACSYVCPSQIPLVHYYRVAKVDIRQQQQQEIKAERAKQRFEARKLRLEQDKIKREQKHKEAAAARKAKMAQTTAGGDSAQSAVAAALARVKAKKAADTNQSTATDVNSTDSELNTVQSTEKSQVAAAIARAKAKKAQKAQAMNNELLKDADKPTATDTATENSKSSKVAAAVAKAKAKKLAQQAEANNDLSTSIASSAITVNEQSSSTANAQESNSPEGKKLDKKAQVAAAVAKAKAKKLAKLAVNNSDEKSADKIDEVTEQTSTELEPKATETKATSVDDKKAKVAAAVAKAKAKKQAKQGKSEQSKTEVEAETQTQNKMSEQANAENTQTNSTDTESTDVEQINFDDLKQAQTASAEDAQAEAENLNKADRIKAAIAKAKAKKQAEQQQIADESTEQDTSNDEKAKRIAAVIAKAKAKKQQESK